MLELLRLERLCERILQPLTSGRPQRFEGTGVAATRPSERLLAVEKLLIASVLLIAYYQLLGSKRKRKEFHRPASESVDAGAYQHIYT